MVTAATFCLRSVTSACMRSALARNSAERGLISLLRTLTPPPPCQGGHEPQANGGFAFRKIKPRGKNGSSFLQRSSDHQALNVARALVDLRNAHIAP